MTDTPFLLTWFERAANNAESMGKRDSAALWRAGRQHLVDNIDVLTELVTLRALRARIQAAAIDRNTDDATVQKMNLEFEKRSDAAWAKAAELVGDIEIELPPWLV